MQSLLKHLFLITAAIVIVAACKQNKELPADMVAQVNDAYLLNSNLAKSVPTGLADEMILPMKKMSIKKWVDDEVIYQTATREGMGLTADEKFMVESYAKSLVIQKYLDAHLNKNYRISQKEIEDMYRGQKKEFVRKEDEAHVIHLFMEKKDRAIFKEIKESKNLLEIIKKYYFDTRSTPDNPNGDLGYITISSLPAVIQKNISRLKTGAISAPIRIKGGYHFIQLIDRQKKGSIIDMELVRDELMRRLKWQKREDELIRLKNQLKENFQVQTYLSKVQ